MIKKIILMSGEEYALKEDKIKDIKNNNPEFNYKKIIVEKTNAELLKKYISDFFVYLTTVDMFNINNKILHIVVENSKIASEILNELIDYIGDNILILDVRNKDIRSLLSSKVYKKNTSNIEVIKINKLEEKTRLETILNIKQEFRNNDINFITKEDEDICANYIYDNSNYSYTLIRNQILQLKYQSKEKLSKKDIEIFIEQSFNGNYYSLINIIFKSNTKLELIKILESKLITFDNSEYISFFNIFSYMLKDYIRYVEGAKCKNPSNYYTFKNSSLKIINPNELLVKIFNLNFKCRTESVNIKEEFLMIIWNYFE